jgi:hypothetical protein
MVANIHKPNITLCSIHTNPNHNLALHRETLVQCSFYSLNVCWNRLGLLWMPSHIATTLSDMIREQQWYKPLYCDYIRTVILKCSFHYRYNSIWNDNHCKQFSVTRKLHCITDYYISAASLSALFPWTWQDCHIKKTFTLSLFIENGILCTLGNKIKFQNLCPNIFIPKYVP